MNATKGRKGFVSIPLAERFARKIGPADANGCWPWTGSKARRGYGQIYVDGRQRRASRVAWELANGKPFPAHLDACHTCDNPPCVNPAHIWPGTPSQNGLDSVAKGRHPEKQKRHCENGHDLSEARVNDRGHRFCRKCAAERRARWIARGRKHKAAARTALKGDNA